MLLDALRDNNLRVRRNAIGALKKMRAQSGPLIAGTDRRRQIPAEYLPEIKAAFDSGYHSQLEGARAV